MEEIKLVFQISRSSRRFFSPLLPICKSINIKKSILATVLRFWLAPRFVTPKTTMYGPSGIFKADRHMDRQVQIDGTVGPNLFIGPKIISICSDKYMYIAL